MRVKLKTISAGPAGVQHPGTVVEVPDDTGRHMISTGQAEAMDGAPQSAAMAEPVETAHIEDGEAAVMRRPRGRPRGS